MAKTIIDASIVLKHTTGSGVTSVVRAIIECPPSEFAALQALGGLTDATPTATATFILASNDTGKAQ